MHAAVDEELGEGDVLIMIGYDLQENTEHCVKKGWKCEDRLNLSFRHHLTTQQLQHARATLQNELPKGKLSAVLKKSLLHRLSDQLFPPLASSTPLPSHSTGTGTIQPWSKRRKLHS